MTRAAFSPALFSNPRVASFGPRRHGVPPESPRVGRGSSNRGGTPAMSARDSQPSEGTDGPRAADRLRYSVDARAQELELFWKRSLFFWGFIASAFVGYAATSEESGPLSL